MLKRVIFEPTYRCNLKCKMCVPFPEGKYKNKEMTLNDIITVFNNSNVLQRCEVVDISGGEPFIRNDVEEIIEFLINKGYVVGLTTNGWFTHKIKKLLGKLGDNKKRLFVSISVDGIGELHDSIRGVKGSFQHAIETIGILKEFDIPVHINTVMQKENYNSLNQISSYFRKIGVNVTFIPLATFNDGKFPYSKKDIKKVIPYLNNNINLKYVFSHGTYKINSCTAGDTGCFIGADGTVFTCLPTFRNVNIADEFVMGNLIDHALDFDRLWLSDKAEKARQNVKLCKGCNKNCEVSREVRFGKEKQYLNCTDLLKYKNLIPSGLNFDSNKNYFVLYEGWHSIEHSETSYVWTAKSAKLLLKAKSNLFHTSKLNIGMINGYPLTEKNKKFKVDIFVNNQLLETAFFDSTNQYKSVSVNLNKKIINKVYDIRLECSLEWSPDEFFNNGDRRLLGICISTISLV